MSKELKDTIKQLNKKHDNIIITNGKKEKIKSISSGSLILDSQIGISGFPLGKIIEIAGGEAAGKTSLAIAAMKSFQNSDTRKVAFIDL
ncbi:MAG: DNA recombination/repair protein RecA, partial [Mycoplasmataceae bacterium]|nr:DNA recombination/repair protein RecA [Mycoplasmataceae bacterium]